MFNVLSAVTLFIRVSAHISVSVSALKAFKCNHAENEGFFKMFHQLEPKNVLKFVLSR